MVTGAGLIAGPERRMLARQVARKASQATKVGNELAFLSKKYGVNTANLRGTILQRYSQNHPVATAKACADVIKEHLAGKNLSHGAVSRFVREVNIALRFWEYFKPTPKNIKLALKISNDGGLECFSDPFVGRGSRKENGSPFSHFDPWRGGNLLRAKIERTMGFRDPMEGVPMIGFRSGGRTFKVSPPITEGQFRQLVPVKGPDKK